MFLRIKFLRALRIFYACVTNSEEDVTMEAVIDHWLRSRQVAGRLEDWVRDYVVKCVEWIKSEVCAPRFVTLFWLRSKNLR